MYPSIFKKLRVVVLVLLAAFPALAQAAAASANKPAPLGLLRLKDNPKPGEAARLSNTDFAVDDLASSGAGSSIVIKDGINVLVLEPGSVWTRTLRGPANKVSFLSFQVYASQNTVIDIGATRLGLTSSPIRDNFQLMYDDSAAGTLQWKPLNLHVGSGSFGARNLVALPTLTIRLDPVTDTWDLYSGSRLLADGLPLIAAKKEQRQFVVKAGNEGAWISGLVMADENPLYEDENANGIDDRFEREKRGTLLPANASLVERKFLAQQWMESQRRKAPPALAVARPGNDR